VKAINISEKYRDMRN